MNSHNRVKVWDIGIRIFHWSLVMLFFISYVSGEEESLLHVYAGYGVIGLIGFRIVWGFIGTKYARFTNFIYSPSSVSKYFKSLFTANPEHYRGHNPIGGWMIILLLTSLIFVSWSGLEVYGAEGHGPLASNGYSIVTPALADEDKHEEKGKDVADEFWEELHEVLANFTLFLVFIHIAGVLIASVMHREKLIKAMITGYKNETRP